MSTTTNTVPNLHVIQVKFNPITKRRNHATVTMYSLLNHTKVTLRNSSVYRTIQEQASDWLIANGFNVLGVAALYSGGNTTYVVSDTFEELNYMSK